MITSAPGTVTASAPKVVIRVHSRVSPVLAALPKAFADTYGAKFPKAVAKIIERSSGPMSIEQAVDYGLRMHKKDSKCDYTQVGFIPGGVRDSGRPGA